MKVTKKLLLLVLPALFLACDKNEAPAPRNHPDEVFKVYQLPQHKAVFNFAFDAYNENMVQIYKDGQLLVSRNIDADNHHEPFDAGMNESDQIITFEIIHKYKTKRGNEQPWLNGLGKETQLLKNVTEFGFDDMPDGDLDYNDAVVTVKLTSEY